MSIDELLDTEAIRRLRVLYSHYFDGKQPLSIYFIAKTNRLDLLEKFLAASGCLIWAYLLLFS